jgi:hypothetical protein
MESQSVEPAVPGVQTSAQAQTSAQEEPQRWYGAFLDLALQGAHLPAPMEQAVRAQFQGRAFEPQELRQRIEEARRWVSDCTGEQTALGPGRLEMADTRDQLQAAVDDLFGAPRNPDQQALRVHKLSGIRELYLMLTGDYELRGGYDRSRVALATTADFTGLVKNALNKIVVNKWEQLGRAGYDWWSRIVTVEHFNSLQSITGRVIPYSEAVAALWESFCGVPLPGQTQETVSGIGSSSA